MNIFTSIFSIIAFIIACIVIVDFFKKEKKSSIIIIIDADLFSSAINKINPRAYTIFYDKKGIKKERDAFYSVKDLKQFQSESTAYILAERKKQKKSMQNMYTYNNKEISMSDKKAQKDHEKAVYTAIKVYDILSEKANSKYIDTSLNYPFISKKKLEKDYADFLQEVQDASKTAIKVYKAERGIQ